MSDSSNLGDVKINFTLNEKNAVDNKSRYMRKLFTSTLWYKENNKMGFKIPVKVLRKQDDISHRL